MRRAWSFVLLFLCFARLAAQTPQWLWARSGVDSHVNNYVYAEGIALAIDPTGGGVYGGGFFSDDSIQFGNISLIDSIGQAAGFIVKYDTSGHALWAKTVQTNTYVDLVSMACDDSGNVFATGQFKGAEIIFDSLVIQNESSEYGFFIAKYNGAGKLLWARINGGSGSNVGGNGIACDHRGNAFVTGYYDGTSISLDTVVLPDSRLNVAVFTAKINSSGNVLWARTAGADSSGGTASGLGICTNPVLEGNIFVSGVFTDSTITFGNTTLRNPDLTRASRNFFLAKYDSSGNALWAQSAAGDIINEGQPTEDMHGNAYVTGNFSSPKLIFGRDTLSDPNPVYQTAMFIAKYDSSGRLSWTKSGHASTGWCVNADLWNDIYVCGGFDFDSLEIDSLLLYAPPGYYDPMFIVKYDENGNVLCSTTLGSGGDDWSSIGADRFGSAYMSADFYRVSPFILGSDTMFLIGEENDFTAKFTCGSFSCNPAPVVISADSNIICPNDSASICASAGYSTYNWSNGASSRCIVTNLANGYQVTVTDNNQCTVVSNTVNINVYQPLPISVSISGDTLTGYGDNSYQWLLNGLPVSGATQEIYIAPAAGTYTLQITDSHGCVDYSNPVVIAGIAGVMGADVISLFPNPSSSGWQLNVPDKLVGSTLEVFDAVGRITYQSLITNRQSVINMPNAAAGVYELRVISLSSTIVRRLIRL